MKTEAWRSEILRELYRHIEEEDREWISVLPDDELRALMARIGDAEDFEKLLDSGRGAFGRDS